MQRAMTAELHIQAFLIRIVFFEMEHLLYKFVKRIDFLDKNEEKSTEEKVN